MSVKIAGCRRVRVRSAGAGEGPAGVPAEVVPRGGADPLSAEVSILGGGRRGAACFGSRPELTQPPSLLAAQRILVWWMESKRWVDFFNPDRRKPRRRHRRPGLYRREVLRLPWPRRHHQGRCKRGRRGEASASQASAEIAPRLWDCKL